ncbi:MAG: hypothetical protein ABW080_00265 [Candidatus Thiodiazotropha sp.]
MPKPRKAIVLLEEAPYYHCVSRCVRRAFLCGVDTHTGKSYEHRRQLIVDRMKLLADVFAIDICAYAVLSNHYHIILHVDTERAAEWSEQEVITRWVRPSERSERYDPLVIWSNHLLPSSSRSFSQDKRMPTYYDSGLLDFLNKLELYFVLGLILLERSRLLPYPLV